MAPLAAEWHGGEGRRSAKGQLQQMCCLVDGGQRDGVYDDDDVAALDGQVQQQMADAGHAVGETPDLVCAASPAPPDALMAENSALILSRDKASRCAGRWLAPHAAQLRPGRDYPLSPGMVLTVANEEESVTWPR